MYQVSKDEMNAESLNSVLKQYRAIQLPVGHFTFDAPILLPDEYKGNHWSRRDGMTWNVQGAGENLTFIKASHDDWVFKQACADEYGVRGAPTIAQMTIEGNEDCKGGIWAHGWRNGSIQDLNIHHIPNGIGILIDGDTYGGSWYNTIERCSFGSNEDLPETWVDSGVVFSGNESGAGKTNENTVKQCDFQNCVNGAIIQTGQNGLDEQQRGVNGGGAFNRSMHNTIYAHQALFNSWDDRGRSTYKARGIVHDSNGGFYSHGDYFERVYYPIWQTQKVTDDLYHMDSAVIKNSGRYELVDESVDSRGFRRRYVYECVREGQGRFTGRFRGNLGFNIWTGKKIQI